MALSHLGFAPNLFHGQLPVFFPPPSFSLKSPASLPKPPLLCLSLRFSSRHRATPPPLPPCLLASLQPDAATDIASCWSLGVHTCWLFSRVRRQKERKKEIFMHNQVRLATVSLLISFHFIFISTPRRLALLQPASISCTVGNGWS